MSTILNIRGTTGSGKTTAVRQVMEHFGVAEELTRGKRPWAYRLCNGTFVLGPYERPCGGAEGMTFDAIKTSVVSLAGDGDVLFEGLLWSTVFKSSDELVQLLPEHHLIFALLDTPAELCLQRVVNRRQETGNTRPFDAANVFTKHKRIAQTLARLQQAGHDARIIPHENVLPTILSWLGKAKGATA